MKNHKCVHEKGQYMATYMVHISPLDSPYHNIGPIKPILLKPHGLIYLIDCGTLICLFMFSYLCWNFPFFHLNFKNFYSGHRMKNNKKINTPEYSFSIGNSASFGSVISSWIPLSSLLMQINFSLSRKIWMNNPPKIFPFENFGTVISPKKMSHY